MGERGQTTQDYVIGITLLLLTLTSVFFVVPTYYAPFDDPIDNEEVAMAENAATYLVETSAVPDQPNRLNNATLNTTLYDVAELKREGGLRDRTRINVSVTRNRSTRSLVNVSAHDTYRPNRTAAATAVRFVTFANESQCRPVCRLVVYVW